MDKKCSEVFQRARDNYFLFSIWTILQNSGRHYKLHHEFFESAIMH